MFLIWRAPCILFFPQHPIAALLYFEPHLDIDDHTSWPNRF